METNAAASYNINALLPVSQDFYLARLFHRKQSAGASQITSHSLERATSTDPINH